MNIIRGFTLIGTLFILILLGILGTYLLKLGFAQQQSINYTLLTVRARHALESGLELAEQQWLKNPAQCPHQVVSFDQKMGALAGYKVVITCPHFIVLPEKSPKYYSCQLQAVAQRGNFGDKDYVSQQDSRWLVLEKKL